MATTAIQMETVVTAARPTAMEVEHHMGEALVEVLGEIKCLTLELA